MRLPSYPFDRVQLAYAVEVCRENPERIVVIVTAFELLKQPAQRPRSSCYLPPLSRMF